ncbi:ABC transporter ATP-binding protein [Abiotrophia defectiva]|uniref:ABC transporter ATP-binding protein n=1 Tax=Abiotrophia defectiva TaxID=46125 RepID=UPI0028D70C6E|nr:ABC transporter ATP-binding protein [Abiotrophia defectiva]
MTTVHVHNISKKFKNKTIFENLDLTLEGGKIYGVVGYNGSGKTVLLKCLCGLESVSSGRIEVDGQVLGRDLQFPPSLGLILETPGFLEGYSGFDNLKQLALIKGLIDDDTIRHHLALVGLDPQSRQKVKHYSLGMKQKLALAQAFMESPEIILLDEPMNGLDKQSVNRIRQLLLDYRAEGRLILIASHLEQDIELLSDQVIHLS